MVLFEKIMTILKNFVKTFGILKKAYYLCGTIWEETLSTS